MHEPHALAGGGAVLPLGVSRSAAEREGVVSRLVSAHGPAFLNPLGNLRDIAVLTGGPDATPGPLIHWVEIQPELIPRPKFRLEPLPILMLTNAFADEGPVTGSIKRPTTSPIVRRRVRIVSTLASLNPIRRTWERFEAARHNSNPRQREKTDELEGPTSTRQ